ncbi:MAG: pyridoxal phosphate-dependent aminotransferase [Oscillibacter sp.]
MKFSSKIEQCGLSPMRKFLPYEVAAVAKGRSVYHLNIGQPDIETPPAFFDAVKGFRQPVLAYAPAPGIPAYLDAVKTYYDQLGIHFSTENILATSGGSEALQMALTCILDDGDEILIPEPFYPNYHTFVSTTGAAIRPIPTTAEEGYRYAQRSRIEPLINAHTRAILITNPGNPTGAVLTAEEMRLMADIAKEHDLFLISDEVYREFVYGGEKLASMAEFEDVAENVVLIDSVSKRFSACGGRVGVLISRNQGLIGQAMKLCQGRLCSATLDQMGAAALYTVDPAYFAAVREEYKNRRDVCMAGLKKIPGVVCECPKGAFYIMAKLPVDDTDKFQLWLLEEFEDGGETVMFAPGEGFYGTPGKGRDEVRLAYILNQTDLARAMEILGKGIAAYNSRR